MDSTLAALPVLTTRAASVSPANATRGRWSWSCRRRSSRRCLWSSTRLSPASGSRSRSTSTAQSYDAPAGASPPFCRESVREGRRVFSGGLRETFLPMSSEQSVDGARSGVEKPTALSREAWGGVLKRTVAEFREDNVTDWAAALTYYGILSVFPALIALVSILGLIGDAAIDPLLQNLGTFAPGPARQILENALHGLTGSRGGAGILFVIGLAAAIWSAAGSIGA